MTVAGQGERGAPAVAVLFMVFARPDTTERVFDAIRAARPARLYVAADGPRAGRAAEAERVSEVRSIATAVDWPCELRTLFRDTNLGCRRAVSGALDWFFEHEDQGIVLEDDCLPHPDFFVFCAEMLERYRDDPRVAVVTGDNFQGGRVRGDASYYFSRYPHCWGWATWRRAWAVYSHDITFWPGWRDSPAWRAAVADPVERRYWTRIFDRVHAGDFDSAWDYPWTAAVWHAGALTATPNVNLVTNIGFGPGATHTDSASRSIRSAPLGALVHPPAIERCEAADRHAFDHHFGGRYDRMPLRLLADPYRMALAAWRACRGARA
jgi:hypothetical protein